MAQKTGYEVLNEADATSGKVHTNDLQYDIIRIEGYLETLRNVLRRGSATDETTRLAIVNTMELISDISTMRFDDLKKLLYPGLYEFTNY